MSNNSDKEWEKWGATDPYYGVVSSEKFRSQNISNTRDEFFRSGEEFISRTLETFELSVGLPSNMDRALDFGCGVGRLTIPLAKRFGSATGMDISPSMLKEARKNGADFGVENVNWILSDETLSGLHGKFDFINSYIVFQHMQTSRGYQFLDQILGMLNAGGAAMIHISLRRDQSGLRKAIYQLRRKLPFIRPIFNILRGHHPFAAWMEMNEYDLTSILEIFSKHGLKNVLVSLEEHRNIMTAKCSARKSAP